MLDSLLARIDGKRQELVELTRVLVQFPTVNPPGDGYDACVRYLGERLAPGGFTVEYVRAEGAPGDSARYPRLNLIARIAGQGAGPCVHFNGHIDVVQAGHGWTVEPFAGTVRDGRVYGRGTCDMKGGLASAVIAVEAIVESGVPFPGALEISATVDEESGGYAGVGYLARKGYFSKPRVDHVIIPEPLDVDRVCIGHRGVWWAEIETLGRIGHGSMPFLGDCAIRHMGALLARFERDLFPRLARRRTGMPVVPDAARHATLNLTAIHGGLPQVFDGLPSPLVPDRCRLLIDRRFLLEEDLDEVKTEVASILDQLKSERPDFKYRIKDVMQVLPTMTSPEASVVRAVAAGVRHVLGKAPDVIASPGTYDQKHIQRIGKLDECIAYGPGILELAHQPDEYVVIEDLVAASKVMAFAALRLLGAHAA